VTDYASVRCVLFITVEWDKQSEMVLGRTGMAGASKHPSPPIPVAFAAPPITSHSVPKPRVGTTVGISSGKVSMLPERHPRGIFDVNLSSR